VTQLQQLIFAGSFHCSAARRGATPSRPKAFHPTFLPRDNEDLCAGFEIILVGDESRDGVVARHNDFLFAIGILSAASELIVLLEECSKIRKAKHHDQRD
jgi:hypothetical protein